MSKVNIIAKLLKQSLSKNVPKNIGFEQTITIEIQPVGLHTSSPIV
jgi:hypothetical protein